MLFRRESAINHLARLFGIICLLLAAAPAWAAANAWTATGRMTTAREYDTVTLLPSGKVLAVGGDDINGPLASTELYDPATGAWSAAAALANPLDGHTATLLPSGKVLVTGGNIRGGSCVDNFICHYASTWLYDPATNSWAAAGSMATARSGHTATLLSSGKVLVVGGTTDYNANSNTTLLASAELYDPATDTWSPAGALTTARQAHTAVLLPSGKVLVVGGAAGGYLASGELYDPATNTWSSAGAMAEPRLGHTATLLPSGKVLVTGGQNSSSCNDFAGICYLASTELYDPVTNGWSSTGLMTTKRYAHAAALLASGKVLIAGGYFATVGNGTSGKPENDYYLTSAELYDPTTNSFSAASSMLTARIKASATLLSSGEVLMAGGYNNSGCDDPNGDCILAAAELFDQTAGAWSPAAWMATGRQDHTATLLPTGKVLVTGGYNSDSLASVESYDAATNLWSPAGSLATPRKGHTATLLPKGKVLVTGGYDSGSASYPAGAELYDPTTNSWTAAGSPGGREYHTATLLLTGKVLVVGGYDGGVLASAELYDPATNTWASAGSLANAREHHTATLLPSGKVLVVGGYNGGALASAELYDPATNQWSSVHALATARAYHTATLLPSGKVLVAGGENASPVAGAEAYDPATDNWSAAGALVTARYNHTATLLPSGNVLIAGGEGGGVLASAELYDPASNAWVATVPLTTARFSQTATLLPTGAVLVTGGGSGGGILASAELHDPATTEWSSAGWMTTVRQQHIATLLPSGKVLVTGGSGSAYNGSPFAESYDPATNVWTVASDPATLRDTFTVTLLPSGKVLMAGGENNCSSPDNCLLTSAELYDPATDTWSPAGSMAAARSGHTATLLSSGKVLVAGGYVVGGNGAASAELYDPATNTWSPAGTLVTAREYHTATLLPSGKVLLAGGCDASACSSYTGILASTELYDPATNTWSSAGSLVTTRREHTATLLPSGKVLIAGGFNFVYGKLASAELYDPATNTSAAVGSLATSRNYHAATLLPSGKVLVTGGQTILPDGQITLAAAEVFDPARNAWIAAGSLATAPMQHTATLLLSGKVLIAGGEYASSSNGVATYATLASAELYDPGLAPDATRQPALSAVSAFLSQTGALAATADASANDATSGAVEVTGFMPPLGASGGASNDSSTNAPVLQVQRIDNDQTIFVANDETVNLGDTLFTGSATAFAGFPAGPVRVRAWVNGIPSAARYATFAPTPAAQVLTFDAEPTVVVGGTGTVKATSAVPNSGNPVRYSTSSTDCSVDAASGVVTGIHAGTGNCTVLATQAGNASWSEGSATLTFSIGKGAGTVDFGTLTFVYDGNAKTVTATLQEDATAVCTVTPASIGPAAAAYPVGADCSGNDYTGSGSATATIAKATGHIAYDSLSFTYDGAVETVTAHIAEEAATACQVTGASIGPAVGNYTVSVSNCDGTNYTAADAGSTVKISPAQVTVTALAAQKNYGAADPAFAYTSSPALFAGDSFGGSLSRDAGEMAGHYAITQGTLSAGANYSITFIGATLDIVAIAPGSPTGASASAGDGQATVSFVAPSSDGGAAIQAYTVVSNAGQRCTALPPALSCTVTGLSNGTSYTFTVTATNSAGTSVPSKPSNAVTPQASQTITFDDPGQQVYGTTPTVTASASSGLAVSLEADLSTADVCSVATTADITRFTLSFAKAGTCTLDATQAGDAGHSAAATVSHTFQVVRAAGTIVFGPLTFTYDGTAKILSAQVAEDANASCIVTPSSIGPAVTSVSVTANCTGTNYTASATQTASIVQAAQPIAFNAAPTVAVGGIGTVRANDVGLHSGNAIVYSTVSSDCSVNTNGSVTGIHAGTGNCTIMAGQGGDANFLSGSATQTFSIGKGIGTVAWGTLSFTYDGTAKTVSAHVVEEPATACTVAPTSIGPAAGSYGVSASCTGTDYTASATNTAVISIVSGNLSVAANPTEPAVDQAVTLTITVSGQSPTGTVTVTEGAAILCGPLAITTNGNTATATCSTSFATSGAHTLSLNYSGDAGNASTTVGNALTIDVALNPTSLNMTASPTSLTQGQSVLLTATVTGAVPASAPTAHDYQAATVGASVAPSGTVAFFDGATTLGSGTLDAGGTATLTVSNLGVGTHAIGARYGGDGVFAQSAVSVPIIVTVAAATSTPAQPVAAPMFDRWITLLLIGLIATGGISGLARKRA